MAGAWSPPLSNKNEVPNVRLASYVPRGILSQEGLPLARGARLSSLRSPRDLTLGGVAKETYFHNSPAVKEERLNSANDSSSHDNDSVVKIMKTFGSKSSPLLLPSLEDRITGKFLKSYKPSSRNGEAGDIGPVVINDVEIKSEGLPEGNAQLILKPAPQFTEKHCATSIPSSASNFILPNDTRGQNRSPVAIKEDRGFKNEPLALKEIKTEPLDVEFESIITVEQDSELKSECLPPIREFPIADQPFNSVDDTFSTEADLPVQSPKEPGRELGIGTKLLESLHSLKSKGPEDLEKQSEKLSHKCNVCQSVFSNLGALKEHFTIHTEDLEKYSVMHQGKWSYKCNICQMIFFKPGNLKNHLIFHAGINKVERRYKTVITEDAISVQKKLHNGDQIFKCEICKKGFLLRGTLMTHSCVHIVSDVSGRTCSNLGNLKRHVLVDTSSKKKHKCGMCYKTFKSNFKLTIHERIHSGEKPFHCEICPCAFSNSAALKCHLRIHTGEKPFKCKVCSSAFRQLSDLKYHNSIHTGERPFNCEQCKANFNRPSSLRLHMMVHTGERPHKCKLCGKDYRSSSHLQEHVASHGAVKPHICKVCNKGFMLACRLKYHLLTHSEDKPFKCVVCSKGFHTHDGLLKHAKRHSITRSFICEFCTKSFKTSSELKRHAKIHRLEKPFVCDVCNKSFYRADDLETHLSIHIE